MARPFRKDYLIAVLAFLLKDSPAWILPVITAMIIDTVVAGGPLASVLTLGLVALVVLVQNYPMHMVFVRRSSRATRSIAYKLRTSLAEHLQKLTVSFHQRVSGSVIQTKIVRDVENIELMIQQSLPVALSGLFSVAGAIVIIAFNIPIFLAVFGLVIPIAVGLIILFRSRSRVKNEEFRSRVENFSVEVGEMSSMLPVVRAHAIESLASSKVAQSAEELKQKGQELDWLNGRFGALAWLSYQILGLASLLLAATVSILDWIPITAGQVVLVASYFGVLMGTAIGLLNILPSLAKGVESVSSIEELLNAEDLEHNEGKQKLESISGSVNIQDLNLEISGRKILSNINLKVEAQKTIAFVGPSGSGKTTLLQSIIGLVRPTSGEVIFDGHKMSEVDMRSVRGFIGLVPQESVVLDGSIRDNVAMGLNQIDSQIRDSLKRANLAELASSDLGEILGRAGLRLSVGQKQRLAIARALYREPKLLVLDEATSALDMESERFIQQTLDELSSKVTMILVAHRLSTVRGADQIHYMESGRILESGTHQELMNLKGAYYRMIEGKEIR